MAEENYDSYDFSSFYYSDEKTLKKIDDTEILLRITEKYPDFTVNEKENILKKLFVVILNDDKFIASLIDYYSISIHDLFRILSKPYGFIFSAYYISQLTLVLKKKKYARDGFIRRDRRSKIH